MGITACMSEAVLSAADRTTAIANPEVRQARRAAFERCLSRAGEYVRDYLLQVSAEDESLLSSLLLEQDLDEEHKSLCQQVACAKAHRAQLTQRLADLQRMRADRSECSR